MSVCCDTMVLVSDINDIVNLYIYVINLVIGVFIIETYLEQ